MISLSLSLSESDGGVVAMKQHAFRCQQPPFFHADTSRNSGVKESKVCLGCSLGKEGLSDNPMEPVSSRALKDNS